MPADTRASRAALIHGVYAITPDESDCRRLLAKVEPALQAGIRILQYRNKQASTTLKTAQLLALMPLCRQHSALLVVNDDWRLARQLGIDAVHLGADDGDLAEARAGLGAGALIGVSCYASLERARQLAPHADYLAFGALFPSGTKPQAPGAALDVLGQARALGLGRPIVGIGGIDANNIASVLAAGADAAAVIGALFNPPDTAAAARSLLRACAHIKPAARPATAVAPDA